MKILTLLAFCTMMALTRTAGEFCLVKQPASCPCGWTEYYNHCFLYVAKPMTWADAQKNCQIMNANLASVHSADEYQMIQKVIFAATNEDGTAWIGGSDAQQENYWFWIDGTPFTYLNWGSGQPDNLQDRQNCMKINWGDKKLWDDATCNGVFPSVCAKNI